MLRSMTGYGAAQKETPDFTVRVEVKSLNSKTMELRSKLPPRYAEKELDIQSFIENMLVRGKVDVTLQMKLNTAEGVKKSLNTALADAYFQDFSQLYDHWQQPKERLGDIVIGLPDLLTPDLLSNNISDEEWKIVLQTITSAIEMLESYRKTEGQKLEEKILEQIGIIEKITLEIQDEKQKRINSINNKIKNRLAELESEFNKDRFEQELIYYMEKLDITEELVRLDAHLKYFHEVMDNEEVPGKKLGFIAQEIGREINTLGSKANDFEIQKKVVIMKDELEKIKQQLANIL